MRFEFYTSLTMAALLAAENHAVSFTEEESIYELPQIWSTEGEQSQLAHVISSTGQNTFAELDAESSENPSYDMELAQTKSKTKAKSKS